MGDYIVDTVKILHKLTLSVRNFFGAWLFLRPPVGTRLFPPAGAGFCAVHIYGSGPAKGKNRSPINGVELAAHQMVHPLIHTVDPSAVPQLHLHTVEKRMVFMIPVHKCNGAGEKLLQGCEGGGVVLSPDITRIARDQQNVCRGQFIPLGQPKKGHQTSVLVSCDKNSSSHADSLHGI